MKKIIVCLLFFMSFAACLRAEKYLLDDPIWVEEDQIPMAKPSTVELSQIYDMAENTFAHPASKEMGRARNINTVGQIPDSTWFTNRIGIDRLSMEEILQGPNSGPGPSLPWTIVSAKSEGISPGFRVRDSRGDTYFIKFDPRRYPQLATSAETICTRFFHDIGYNVPAYYLVFLRPESLRVDPKAMITDETGKKRPMTEDDVDRLLERVGKLKDGRIPVSASLRLPGEDLGKFKYYGTRSDDPNDIFLHEDHRELRGLRVFAAWLNHDDSRSINTLNMYLPKDNAGFIRHYLIDFGSTLGSSSVTIESHRSGNEYLFEKGPILRSGLTFGIWDRPWRYYKYPSYREIGRIESTHFAPQKWRPEYPNPAFDRMQNEDALWATEIIMKFTDDIVRAIVHTGSIFNPEGEKYLSDTLIERRNKIERYYLSLLNPLSDFSINGNKIEFKNLGELAGLASQTSYEYQWFRFDNEKDSTQTAGPRQQTASKSIDLPEGSSPYLMLTIRSINNTQPNWKKQVNVYLRNDSNKKIVGIEREN